MITLENFSVVDNKKVLLHPISLTLQFPFKIGLIGESGSGKSTLAKALSTLLSPHLDIRGSLYYEKICLITAKEKIKNQLRKTTLKYLVQEPFFALSPHLKIKTQLKEAFESKPSRTLLQAQLKLVDLDNPHILEAYPHQLSGGQRQRLALLQALIPKPKLLIADEPTTALDQILHRHILKLIQMHTTSLLFVSHDLEAVALMTDEILVLYQGYLVEKLPSSDLFFNAHHPYTRALVNCLPLQNKTPTPIRILNNIPSSGCPFAPYCCQAQAVCFKKMPPFKENIACHNPWKADDRPSC